MFKVISAMLALLPISGAVVAGMEKAPGGIGAYVTIRSNHLNSPYEMRKLMRDLKAAGVDFILPFSAKDTMGKVHWDSKIAPREMLGTTGLIEMVVKYAHAEGLKVYPVYSYEACQDWVSWIKNGHLDWINPTGYRYDDEVFLDTARQNRALIPKDFPYYVTIGVATSHGKLETADDVIRQIKMCREAGAYGIVFFRWHSLEQFLPEVTPLLKAWPDI